MNIKYPEKMKVCNVRDIQAGGIFLMDNSTFLKTTDVVFNAVRLETGDIFKIDETIHVIPLTGTLVIDENEV